MRKLRNYLAMISVVLGIGAAFAAVIATIHNPALIERARAQGFFIPDGSGFAGHVSAGGPIPTLVGCTIIAGSTDLSGSCTTSAASGSITFGRTYGTAPTCLVVDATATSTVSMPVYTVSATAITLTTIITAHTLHWFCPGKIGST